MSCRLHHLLIFATLCPTFSQYWSDWFIGSTGGVDEEPILSTTDGSHITKICTKSTDRIHEIEVWFHNGDHAGPVGDSSADSECFEVEENECFASINLRQGSVIDAMQMVTSTNRTIPFWGDTSGGDPFVISGTGKSDCISQIQLTLDIKTDGLGDQFRGIRAYFITNSSSPTSAPSSAPTDIPTNAPTVVPSDVPTVTPTVTAVTTTTIVPTSTTRAILIVVISKTENVNMQTTNVLLWCVFTLITSCICCGCIYWVIDRRKRFKNIANPFSNGGTVNIDCNRGIEAQNIVNIDQSAEQKNAQMVFEKIEFESKVDDKAMPKRVYMEKNRLAREIGKMDGVEFGSKCMQCGAKTNQNIKGAFVCMVCMSLDDEKVDKAIDDMFKGNMKETDEEIQTQGTNGNDTEYM